MSSVETEAEVLRATASKLSEQGYDVIIQPTGSLLPQGMEGLRPDAIALGREPKLLIEVKSEGAASAKRLAGIQALLKDHPDWKLHLVLVRSAPPAGPGIVSDDEIANAVANAAKLAELEPRAALLICWAAFEALSRSRQSADFTRPQTPGRLVEILASQAVVTPEEAGRLRAWAKKRNDYIHGGLDVIVGKSEVWEFSELLTRLLAPDAFSQDQLD